MAYRDDELEKAVLNCVDRMDMHSIFQYVIDDLYEHYKKADKLYVDKFIEAYGDE